jgi:hypothetical protein
MRGNNASETRRATPQQESGEDNEGGPLNNKEWKDIKKALISIKEGLEKEKIGERFVEELSKVIARVSNAP